MSDKTSLARIMNRLLMSASAQAATLIPSIKAKEAAIAVEEQKNSTEERDLRKSLRKKQKPITLRGSRRRTEKGHLGTYASETDAGRAMRRAQRWMRANPNVSPEQAPRHIWEKLSAMSEALA